jgi:hypothetical protein
MLDNYRVICVTPAGRRRYMQNLVRHVLSCPLVDEYQLWKNTSDESDIAYLYRLQSQSPKVRVIEPTTDHSGQVTAIGQFFRNCIDDQSIYVRFDDDIVYLEPNFLQRFLRFRIDNPDHFLVFPNVINNAICTYIQAVRGLINPGMTVYPWAFDRVTWWTPHFAEQLHRAFLESLTSGDIASWYFGPRIVGLSRFSVNCMAWFGRDFAHFGGIVPQDEEGWLSVIKPTELMRSNCVYGDVIVGHFAFYTQQEYLDTTDVLKCYAAVAERDRSFPSESDSPHDTKSGGGMCQQNSKWSDGDSFWTSRLLASIKRLTSASAVELQNVAWIAEEVRFAGLAHDVRLIYGRDNAHMNAGAAGIHYIPCQLAKCLVQLSNYEIRTVIHARTFSGWAISFITAYLARFNPSLRVTTVDTVDSFYSYSVIKGILPINFQAGKSLQEFDGSQFDLAIIDGEHSYASVAADYEAVCRLASVFMLQDINDKYASAEHSFDGGTPRFWRRLISRELTSLSMFTSEVFSYTEHPESDRIKGLGLVASDKASRRQQSSFSDRLIKRRLQTLGVVSETEAQAG